MDLVEIPVGKFLYRFRRLTWLEESRIVFPEKVDQREIVLALALDNVSDLPVSREDALKVIRTIPTPIRWRMWVLYRGKLPVDRKFSTRNLYDAPERKVYDRKLLESGDNQPESEDDVIARRFGPAEAAEARELKQAMLAQARKAGAARQSDPEVPRG